MRRFRARPVGPGGGGGRLVLRLPEIATGEAQEGGEETAPAGLYVERYTRPDGRCYAIFYLTGVEYESVTFTYVLPSGVSRRELSDTIIEFSTASYTDPLSVTLTHAGVDYSLEVTICE